MRKKHYLEEEFYQKIQKDKLIFDFLETNSLDGIWYWDMENPENEWLSPRFWEVLGYSHKEKKHLVSQWQELIFPEDLEKTIENFNKHYEDSNYPYDQIVRYKHKKGHTVWIRCRGNIIRDEKGKPLRMIGVHNDITIQKINEEKSNNKSNVLKTILDSSLNGIIALDSLYDENNNIIDFIFTVVNKEACKMTNLKEDDIVGKRLSNILTGNFKPLKSLDGKTLFDEYKDVVLTGKSKSLEFYFEDDGIKDWFRNKVVKYNNGFVCTFEVITQEKNLHENLEKRVKEELEKQRKQEEILIQQSKMAAMGEMIAAIAHNWRQPLNTVSLLCIAITNKFNSSNLSKDYLNEWLLKINKQIDFMSQTIDDFRNFYKPQEEFKKISIKESILKTVSLLNTDFKGNGIDIKIDIEDSIYLICLENQLKQALINILINAKDAIKNNNIENGEIFISVKKNKSSVEILIEDNGGGIDDKEILTSIFDLYFTTKKESYGTGIGLYMTKIIIEQNLGGKIKAKNQNNGLKFKIKLPILTI